MAGKEIYKHLGISWERYVDENGNSYYTYNSKVYEYTKGQWSIRQRYRNDKVEWFLDANGVGIDVYEEEWYQNPYCDLKSAMSLLAHFERDELEKMQNVSDPKEKPTVSSLDDFADLDLTDDTVDMVIARIIDILKTATINFVGCFKEDLNTLLSHILFLRKYKEEQRHAIRKLKRERDELKGELESSKRSTSLLLEGIENAEFSAKRILHWLNRAKHLKDKNIDINTAKPPFMVDLK